MNITSDTPVIIQTQTERRIAILEGQLAEACASNHGLRLALEEANRQIEELTQPQVRYGTTAGTGQEETKKGKARG